MARGEAVIVAGLGFRRGCPADHIVEAVFVAEDKAARQAGALAAPEWKHGDCGLNDAAYRLKLPIHFVSWSRLKRVQSRCVTQSVVVARATGLASVAEAAALAVAGRGRQLLLPRIVWGSATCALAER